MSTALLAESDEDLLDAYRGYLSQRGFHVETARTGLECLAKLREFVPDLLVLDLALNWGGGDGVLQVMREDSQLLPHRVLVTLPDGGPEGLDGFAPQSTVRIVTKPAPLSSLLEAQTLDTTHEPYRSTFVTRRRGVLVVDDTSAVRVLLQGHLQNHGFPMRTASNGTEALFHLCDHSGEIAVVLLSYELPGRDSIDTWEKIRKLDRRLPVCFLANELKVHEKRKLLQQGAYRIFTKPFRMNDIVCIVEDLVSSRSDRP
jgi:DNA-binding response OmpR family regulator